MTRPTEPVLVAQAYVQPLADDPEGLSAFAVARDRLAAGARLVSLRRVRLFELRGRLPGRAGLEDLLHRSTQFYNPAKERCLVRAAAEEGVPFEPDEQLALVAPRGAERRGAAERWWRHETGAGVQVREGIAWAMRFEPGAPAATLARELTELRDRAHGLLCNPHAQTWRMAEGRPPLPWFGAAAERASTARRRESR